MSEDPLRYEHWIEDALRSVARRALDQVARHGLYGDHHLYLTFRTGAPGVRLPPYLKAQHPDEMTIVLQHQFDDLTVDDESFAVTLRFKGKAERLYVPFSALTSFADPSCNFGLQFKSAVPVDAPVPAGQEDTPAAAASKAGEVIALDAFRKK